MIHSFLLIGQSNMAGRGLLKDAPKIDTKNIRILRNGRWQPMFRPINPDREFSGSSLAESFAEKYAETYKVEVGLICCADGNTNLEQWQPGGVLYENAVHQAKLASRSSILMGVLWHQGEADCAKNLAESYQERFESIMRNMRKDLALEDAPFLVGGLGDFLQECTLSENFQNYPIVNDALRKIAEDNPMTGFVSAHGLKANDDLLHFNADALYEFGIRYFREYDRLIRSNRYDVQNP